MSDENPNRGLEHSEGLEVMKRYLEELKKILPSPSELKELELACNEVRGMLGLLADSDDQSAAAYVDFIEAALNHARGSRMLCQAWEGENEDAAQLSNLIHGGEPN